MGKFLGGVCILAVCGYILAGITPETYHGGSPRTAVAAQSTQASVAAPLPAFSGADIKTIVDDSRHNEIRFNRDYKGRKFSDDLPFRSASQNTFGSDYQVSFGPLGSLGDVIYCYISDQATLNKIVDWNKGRVTHVEGYIKATMFGDLKLDTCVIR